MEQNANLNPDRLRFITRNYWRLKTLPFAVFGFCFLVLAIALQLGPLRDRSLIMGWGSCLCVLATLTGFWVCSRYYRRRFGWVIGGWAKADRWHLNNIGMLILGAQLTARITEARLPALLILVAAGMYFVVWEWRKDVLWNHIVFGFVGIVAIVGASLSEGPAWHLWRFIWLATLLAAMIGVGLTDHWILVRIFSGARGEELHE